MVNSISGDADVLISDDLFEQARTDGPVEGKATIKGEAYRVSLVHLGSA